MRTLSLARRLTLGGACCALAYVVILAGVVPDTSATAQTTVPVNPVRPVAPDDAQADPSHGFLVLVEGDAELYQNEVEGPVAVGGDAGFAAYQVALNNPGTYVAPGDDTVTGLVIGGRPDYPGSPSGGQLNVLSNTYAKIGDLSGSDVIPSGGVTHVVPEGGDEATHPDISIQTAQPADSVAGESGFDFASLFSTYRDINATIARCPQTVRLKDQSGQNEWNGTDPVATLGLRPGQNVLTLTPEQLANLSTINPDNSGLQPGEAAWLVVNVEVAGDYTWQVPNVSWQGNEPSRHVLWNFTTDGTLTLPGGSPTVWGTVYAPNARLVDHSSANIEGNVVVRSFQHGGLDETGAVVADGGEVHYAPFSDLIQCAGVPPTTSKISTPTTTTGGPTSEPSTPGTTTPPTTPGETTTSTTPEGTTVPHASGDGTPPEHHGGLASTGGPTMPWLIAGLALLVAGALLLAGPALGRIRLRRKGSSPES
ncbi:choice-of-anchor A family protein [Saccharomonospora sp. NPDC006951]